MRRFLFWALVILLVLGMAAISSLPFLIRSEALEGFINQAIQKQTAYSTHFEKIRVSFFPTPIVHIEKVELTPQEGADLPLVRAERASFRPSLFSILIGKPALAHGVVKGADIHYTWRNINFVKTISLKDSSIDFWNIASGKPIRFKLKGKFLSDAENVNISGTVRSHFEHFKIKNLNSKLQAQIGPVELVRLTHWWGAPLPIQIQQGTIGLSVQAVKSEGTSNVDIKGNVDLNQLVYQLPPKPISSLPGDYQFRFDTTVDLNSGVLEIKDGSLTTPFGGPFELDGSLNIFSGSVNEIVMKTQSLRLETLPQYILSVEHVLPVNSGFSGETQVDFYAKGEPELLLLNLRVDLTHTNLAYSKYFSKPSGIPLTFKSDMKLAAARALRGDFSLDFEQAALKGSLVGLDLATGDGEMTVLTNKFSIAGWEKYFPLLRQFELSGDIKILTNLKGNFTRLDEARMMNNISLDSLQARSTTGVDIQNLSGSLDSGPMDSELKDLKFEMGNTTFFAEGKMFQQPETKWLINVRSPKIDVADLTSQIRKAAEAIDPEQTQINWNSVENSVGQFFSSSETIEQFEAQLAFGSQRFLIPQMKFFAFGGAVAGRAALDRSEQIPTSFAELDIQRLSLSRMQSSIAQPVLLGNLFSHVQLNGQGPFDDQWLNKLQGRGSISVTNGELHTLDLLGGLGQIAQLAPLESVKSGATRFDDVRGDFDILNQKITTQNMMLVSEDFQIEAQGDMSFAGILNFRLSVYLSPALSQRITPGLGENARLGPIPILIVGPVSQPQVRQDPLLITSFVQSLVQGQFSKITSGFLLKNKPRTDPPQSEESQSLDEQLVQSGFGLLESFLKKKSESNHSSS